MTTRDHQVERFDRWAETYDRSFLQRRVFEPVHEALIQVLGPLEGWAGLGHRLWDRHADAGPGPPRTSDRCVSDSLFDGATASLTFHHWRDAGRGVAELARVLRPGGRAAIADIDLPRPLRSVLRLVRNPHAGWSRRELAGMFYRSGFTRVEALTPGPLGPRLPIIRADR
jgi:SAM-dependent methyltransferase